MGSAVCKLLTLPVLGEVGEEGKAGRPVSAPDSEVKGWRWGQGRPAVRVPEN